MPQMQVFFVGIPLSILAGFLILLLVVGAMMGTFLGSIENVLSALPPAPVSVHGRSWRR
jgi:flagellar biosynthetic protein FliR